MVDHPTIHLQKTPGRLSLLLRSLTQRTDPDAELRRLPEVILPEYSAREKEVRAYRRLCGFPDSDLLPLPYFFVAGFFPQVFLVTSRGFPAKALGMVHLENTFELFREVKAGTTLEVRARTLDLDAVAKGRRLRVETRFFHEDRLVARSLSTSLARGGGHGRKKDPGVKKGPPPGEAQARWTLDGDAGRRYAAVSGDYNPIHLYPWSARLLGFRRPIAHGMYLVARAVAELQSPAPLRTLHVRFKTPTYLPGEAHLFFGREEGDGTFELWNGDLTRPHLVGRTSASDEKPVPTAKS